LLLSLSSWFHGKRVHAELRLSGRPVQSLRVVNPYHAVRIAHQTACCKKVVELNGQLFLAAEAPKIPLPDCDAPKCRCRYIHSEDRRSTEERREPVDGPHHYFAMRDRRLGQGRRAND
jgi:hypothetical protein